MSQGQAQPPERDDTMQAGRLVRNARSRAGISQRELARRSGVPGPVVNAIERSRRQPSVPTLAKLLRGIGLELRLSADPVSAPVTSTRVVTEAERARARKVYDALALADSIKRARARGVARGVR